jgi:hypothetical protein
MKAENLQSYRLEISCGVEMRELFSKCVIVKMARGTEVDQNVILGNQVVVEKMLDKVPLLMSSYLAPSLSRQLT